jgi:amino acid adenylation domain-containing protein
MTAPSLWAALGEVAARRGAAVAVTDGAAPLTYAELTRRAAGLGAALAARGIGPGDLVGVLADQSPDTVVAILGVLCAGAAYVPLDVSYPATRLRFMAEDAGLRVAVGAGGLEGVETLAVPGPGAEGAKGADAPAARAGADDPAYVIYTSGSTGRPKGCVVTHGNVLALVRHTLPLFDVGPADRWSVFHSFSFDFSVWELWGALLTGATAVCVPRETARLPEDLLDFLAAQRVTVLDQVPSAFRALATVYPLRPVELALRYLIFGGESVDLPVVRGFLAAVRGCRPVAVNMYGITETTVHATIKVLDEGDLAGPVASPIGSALPHLTVELRDETGRPVPAGAPGELWISGAGVARGYLRRPELTAQRFVEDGTGRWYRSGDLARQGLGGLEYLGRGDRQVKLRGFRIELGEIEAVLARSDLVAAAAVVAVERPSAGSVLVATVVPPVWPAGPDLVAGLRRHAAAHLPRHMTPARYEVVRELPLTLSGKLDRRGLEAAAREPDGSP